MPKFEWRVSWEASSNATFRGSSGWEPWEGDEETIAEVESAIDKGSGVSVGLDAVINASGFGWWSEVRESEGTPDA